MKHKLYCKDALQKFFHEKLDLSTYVFLSTKYGEVE